MILEYTNSVIDMQSLPQHKHECRCIRLLHSTINQSVTCFATVFEADNSDIVKLR